MIEINYSIAQEDLKALYLLSKNAFGNMSFDVWCESVRGSYLQYVKSNRESHKTFSQWVNGQIIALTQIF